MQPSFREKLIGYVEILLNSTDEEEIKAIEKIIEELNKRIDIETRFSIERIVYSYFIWRAIDYYDPPIHAVRKHILKTLRGEIPYQQCYALKYNMVEFLKGRSLEAYEWLVKYFELFNANKIDTDEYKEAKNKSWELCCEELKPTLLPELMIAHIRHLLWCLPVKNIPSFDIADYDSPDSFSSIYPRQPMEVTMTSQLNYIKELLRKIKGEDVLFVHIQLLSDSYNLNFR